MVFGGIHLAAWDFKFPSLVEEIMWKVTVLTTMGLPVAVLGINAVQWHLLVRAGYALELERWPNTYLEAKAFLTRLTNGLERHRQIIRIPHDLDFSPIHAALAQEGPSPAYLKLLNALQNTAAWHIIWLFPDPVLLRHIKYLQSEMEKRENPPTINLPQIICGMPGPILTKKENIKLRTAIAAQTEWKPLSLGLLYIPLLLYALARIGTIAVAFSCLRAMPDSVYVTTWGDVHTDR